jgi:hypothetical protein
VRGGEVPLTLGQNNFFKVFNLSFYGAQAYFEISSAS